MTITPPPRPTDHLDRFLDAQEAVNDALSQLVDDAVAQGWRETEILAAIVAVAESRMIGLSENSFMEDLLKRLGGGKDDEK